MLRHDRSRMPGEGMGVCACVHVPQPHCPVITPTYDSFSIGTECYAPDPTRMPGEGAGVCACVHED
jgi:hypothetical protein